MIRARKLVLTQVNKLPQTVCIITCGYGGRRPLLESRGSGTICRTSILRRVERKVWSLVRNEASWIDRRGDFRTRERHGRIPRAHFVYGLLRAADLAKFFGYRTVTAIEFGVASGDGLLSL